MRIIERGRGSPLVVVPGLQGRWEYLAAAVDALAESHRVITFPLCDEPSAGAPSGLANGIDGFADQVEMVLDACGIARAAVCGVSFGGLIALRTAARHPGRVSALLLVSTPGPRWHLKPRHDVYARAPWLFGPVFAAESPWRLRREVAMAIPDRRARLRFIGQQARTLLRAPLSVSRMAARARLIGAYDRMADCGAIACPTLIVHGDAGLDHVVDAIGSSEYATLIRGARAVALPGTGHLGSITRPREFAAIVTRFLTTSLRGSHDSAA